MLQFEAQKFAMNEKLLLEGWAHDPADGFIEHVGGMWLRGPQGSREFGLLAQPFHANRSGVVHGGMIMTFLDRAFGQTAREVSGANRTATISFTHQFVAPVRIGDFAVSTPRVTRFTGRLAFVEGSLMRDGEVLVTAQGVWRLVRAER